MSVYACADLKKIFMGKNKLLFYYFFLYILENKGGKLTYA